MDSFTLRTSGYELKKSWPRSNSFLAKFDCLPTHNNTAPKIQGRPQKLHRFVKPRQRSWQLDRRRNVIPEFGPKTRGRQPLSFCSSLSAHCPIHWLSPDEDRQTAVNELRYSIEGSYRYPPNYVFIHQLGSVYFRHR